MKRARIIYNPTSGREHFKKEIATVLDRLEQAGYETSAHATKGSGDATKAAEIAVERKYDLIVIAGGDGTINEVIAGVAEADYRPKIGIIPAGTTNDFARALSIPREVDKAVDIIVKGLKKKLDIGKVNDRSEEHTSELQSRGHLVCRLLLEKKNKNSSARRCGATGTKPSSSRTGLTGLAGRRAPSRKTAEAAWSAPQPARAADRKDGHKTED